MHQAPDFLPDPAPAGDVAVPALGISRPAIPLHLLVFFKGIKIPLALFFINSLLTF